jgi:hypothetical protein
MKSLFTGLIIALVVQSSFAQKAPIKFGNVTMDELNMKVYPADSSADAVILVDFGISTMKYNQEKGFALNFDRTMRIKILKNTPEALHWGDHVVHLYEQGDDEEKISGIKAVTYNLENGKIVETKMKNESILREKYSKNWKKVSIVCPNVKEGSVIEITYTITSDFIFNFQDWRFQDLIPTVHSEYRAQIPEYFSYEKYMQGYIGLAVADEETTNGSITLSFKERSEGNVTRTEYSTEKIDFQEKKYRWVAQNVPAFKEEPYLTTYKDYISKLNFELSFTNFPHQPVKRYMGTWDDIATKYAEGLEDEIKGNQYLKKVVEEVTAGLITPEDKIAAIHAYVRANFAWNQESRDYFNGALKKAFDEKKGNSAEINLVLASMLEKAGFDVKAVVLSTRDHGFVNRGIPMASQFNYVICGVKRDDKMVLLDATDKLIPTGVLPKRCLNGEGLIVSKTGASWIKLSGAKSRLVVNAELALVEDKFAGKTTIDRAGYFGSDERRRYLANGESDYVKGLTTNKPWEISKSSFEGLQEISKPFRAVHELTFSEATTMAGDMLYVNPLFMWRLEENPFKTEQRMYPVDFGNGFDEVYVVKLKIPEGYSVEEVPQSKAAMLPDNAGRFQYNCAQMSGLITITSSLQINKSLYTQEDYPNLREFYKLVVAKQAEQIVLKKVK